jgi:NTE family protein
VLDRLLEDERLEIVAVSGTSAGACNAVALASGWCRGGRDGARQALAQLWYGVARQAGRAPAGMGAFAAFALDLATHLLSPYQLNPLGLNPLRELLTEVVDFRLLRQRCTIPLVIAATEVRTGRCRIFREHELTAEMVLASACLPRLHHAVEIGGSLFWDGGFSSNPPLMALAELARSPTLLLLRLNPVEAHGLPRSAAAIRNRTAEIMFGRALDDELARIEDARRLGRNRWLNLLQPRLRHLAGLDLQIIDGDETLARLNPSTRVSPDRRLLEHLRDEGRAAADIWLSGWAGPDEGRDAAPLIPARLRLRPWRGVRAPASWRGVGG